MVDLENLYEGSLIQERYEIKELIGQGASSNVYKAKDLITNTYVAIKILKDIDDGLSLESFIERMKFFRREYKLLQKISHPNIIRILDSGVYDYKYLFIVMEFLEGTTLSRIISDNSLAPKRVVNILKQLAQGVEAMHSQGVIHRDLNPNNIWISGSEPDEKVKILDFGTAKLIEGVSEEEYLQTITTSGKVVGTLCYLSPEQCRCQKLDIRTDIYSLGIIVYEMLNGYPPFNSESPVMIAAGHMRLHPKEFTEAPNKLQPPVFKALEKDPQNRFSNATEFADAFEKAVVEENFSSSSNLKVNNIETARNTQPQKQTFWQTLASWSKRI
ncbi:MAG: serine/threonine protein kinase [Acidobacteria bacterium]|nr:serine/threonine protein kinase [Acidobacteriota bacterium]